MIRLRRRWLLAIGITLVLGIGLALVTAHRGWGDRRLTLVELGRERILLARISIDDHWSLCRPSQGKVRGYCRPPEVSRMIEPRRLAVMRSQERGDSDRLALTSLLLDRDADRVGQAVSRLEATAQKAPNEENPFIDLAAAQLTLGWVQGSAAGFVDALESADRALEINSANARACFNRALALEELGLRELALQGWERCSHLEKDPEWRSEIEQRAEALRTSPTSPSRESIAIALDGAVERNEQDEIDRWAREQPQIATELVIREFLPQWIEAGPLEQAAWWPGLERLAEGIRRNTGDRLMLDVVRQMRSGVAEGRSREIVAGIRRLRRSLDSYQKRRYHEAVSRLAASTADLQAVPALQTISRVYGAIALHSSGQVAPARQELSRLAQEAGMRAYHWPLGYAHWTLGRIAIIGGSPLEALRHYREALRAFEKIQAEELVLSVNILLAETYSELGQPEQAWQFARQAVHEAYQIGAADRLFFVLNLFAGMAYEQGRSRLALYAQTSALEHASDEPPRSRANAYLWRAYYLLDRKELDGDAQADLRHAEELAREVDDPSESARLEAEIALVRGVLAVQTDPEAAVASLGEAIQLFDKMGERFVRLIALKARADALRKMGHIEEATKDLETAMAAYDAAVRDFAERDGLSTSEPARFAYLRQHADIYQAIIDLYVEDLGSPWRALVLAEHAKSLHEPGTAAQFSLQGSVIDRWTEALPPKTALLSFATAGKHIVAWVLTPTRRQFFQLGRADEVATLAARLHRSRDAETWKLLSRELYSRLVTPLVASLREVQDILIIPSPGLDRVPFPGLLDPRSGKYLVETHLLEMLPSAQALLGEGLPASTMTWHRPLVVGNPGPTNAGLLGLPPLRFAEQEARDAAAALGPHTMLLLGPEATPRRILAEVADADVIHVAGHALSLGRGPDSAVLVLATSTGDAKGLLTAQQILRLPLSGTELVVLSTCSSAGGPVISWQSGLTLARSFLSAGAKRVVATLHAVDDEESAKLFQIFYRELAAGRSASASLRSAQLSVLRWRAREERRESPSWPYVEILESGPSK